MSNSIHTIIMCVISLNSCLIIVLVLLLLNLSDCGPSPQAGPSANDRAAKLVQKARNGDFAYPDELDSPGFQHSVEFHRNMESQFQHNPEFHNGEFQHSPEFHRNREFHHSPDFHYHHGTDLSRFPDQSSSRNEDRIKYNYPNSSMQIPVGFIQNLNKYSVNDLLLNFVEGETEVDAPFPPLQNRFGEDEVQERNAAVMPKEAGCMPELKTVKIVESDDPSVLYIPQCTRVERCGGCCSHVLLSCQPLETEQLSFKVIKTQYTGGKKLKVVGKEIVQVEKHNKCKCDCRTRPEDCNKFQEYRKSECRCACMNFDEEKKCNKSVSIKLWNPELCVCQCRETMQCSTGYHYDHNECRCITSPMRRRHIDDTQRRVYKPEDLTVGALFDYTED